MWYRFLLALSCPTCLVPHSKGASFPSKCFKDREQTQFCSLENMFVDLCAWREVYGIDRISQTTCAAAEDSPEWDVVETGRRRLQVKASFHSVMSVRPAHIRPCVCDGGGGGGDGLREKRRKKNKQIKEGKKEKKIKKVPSQYNPVPAQGPSCPGFLQCSVLEPTDILTHSATALGLDG